MKMKPREKTTFWDKVGSIDNKYLYAGTIAVTMLVIFSGIPPIIAAETSWNIQKTYDYINTLQEGDVVIYSADNNAAYFLAHIPGSIAVLRHAIQKRAKIIMIGCFLIDGSIMTKLIILPQIQSVLTEYGYEYGKDWVMFGFITGGEAALSSFYGNLQMMKTDVFGNNIEDLPVMKDLHDLNDVRLVIQGGVFVRQQIRQVWAAWDKPLINVGLAGAAAWYPVYVQAGQLVSFVHGWPGGAEYEKLLGYTGMATMGVNGLSVLWMVTAVAIIIGNIGWIGKKLEGGS